MDTIESMAGIRAHDGALVSCCGVYRQHDISKAGGAAPAYNGHACIELGDGTRVMLYPVWDPRCFRPAAEIAAHEGKRVTARGRIFIEAPNVASGPPAQNLALPCLTELGEIVPA